MNKVREVKNKVKEPTREQIGEALQILNNFRLSVYQALLYEYDLSLPNGGLLDVENHGMFVNVREVKNKVKEPTREQIGDALQILNNFRLSVYQALYEYDLSLPNGGLFDVKNHDMLVKIICRVNHDYDFFARNLVQAVSNAFIIKKALDENRVKTNFQYCCPLAERRFCVCELSYTCPVHGVTCIGSHD